MTSMQDPSPVTASLVEADARLNFLPAFFGPRLMIRGEAVVYGWLGALSKDYDGGYWNFYMLSNGGFFMAPAGSKLLCVVCEGNGFDGELSPDAVGIVATLFALCQLANESGEDHIIHLYHLLREYLHEHPEGGKIYGAID